jgi:hypothetical protein
VVGGKTRWRKARRKLWTVYSMQIVGKENVMGVRWKEEARGKEEEWV